MLQLPLLVQAGEQEEPASIIEASCQRLLVASHDSASLQGSSWLTMFEFCDP
jgi:hypothetical protein